MFSLHYKPINMKGAWHSQKPLGRPAPKLNKLTARNWSLLSGWPAERLLTMSGPFHIITLLIRVAYFIFSSLDFFSIFVWPQNFLHFLFLDILDFLNWLFKIITKLFFKTLSSSKIKTLFYNYILCMNFAVKKSIFVAQNELTYPMLCT